MTSAKNRSAIFFLCALLPNPVTVFGGIPYDQATSELNFDEATFLSSILAEHNSASRPPQDLSRRDLVHLLRRADAESSKLRSMLGDSVAPGYPEAKRCITARESVDLSSRIEIPIAGVGGVVSFQIDEEPLYYEYSFTNNSGDLVAAPVLYDRFLWNSAEGLIQSGGFRGIPDETDRALAIWDFVVRNRYHFFPPTSGEEVRDLIKFLSIYGYGFCDNSARTLARLADEVGLKGRIWFLGGHVVPEINADGRWILLDPDLQLYFNDPADTKHIYGVEELVADPSLFENLTTQNRNAGPSFQAESKYKPFPEEYKDIFLSTDDNVLVEEAWHKGVHVRASADYIIADRLRPGERIAFTNYSWGKYFIGPGRDVVPAYYNGYYSLPLDARAAHFSKDEVEAQSQEDGWLAINRSTTKSTKVTIRNRYGFPILGAALLGDIRIVRGDSKIIVRDHSNQTRSEYVLAEPGPTVIDSAFSILSTTPTYDFSLAFELGPNSAILFGAEARLVSEFQFSSLALATVKPGSNTLKLYTKESSAERFSLELSYCTAGTSHGHACIDGNTSADPLPRP